MAVSAMPEIRDHKRDNAHGTIENTGQADDVIALTSVFNTSSLNAEQPQNPRN